MKELASWVRDRHNSLMSERVTWDDHWKEIYSYLMPRRGRFLGATETNKGGGRNQKIIDNTATMALITFQAGMMTGLTSPARPWFRLTLDDPELREYRPVKLWLEPVEERIRATFAGSNFYTSLQSHYTEMASICTAAMTMLDDPKTVIRCYPHTGGEYALGQNQYLRVDNISRVVPMTARQMVERFGDNVPPGIRSAYNEGKHEQLYEVIHLVEPNPDFKQGSLDPRGKRFRSLYVFEEGVVGMEGFYEFPTLTSRWGPVAMDTYGSMGPGMVTLGDIKQLQIEQKTKGRAIEKVVDPPLTAGASMKKTILTSIPGGISYHPDDVNPQLKPSPLYQINPDLGSLREDIVDVRGRIRAGWFTDLFLMLTELDRAGTGRQMTAREIEERHGEKLLVLGPVLERLKDETLDPAIDRCYEINDRKGLIPPPPKELQGKVLGVELISSLAMAQKAAALRAQDAFVQRVGEYASVNSEVVDIVDWDELARESGRAVGISPRLMREPDVVFQMREERRRAQEMQSNAAMMTAMVKAGKDAAGIPTGAGPADNLFTDMIAGG